MFSRFFCFIFFNLFLLFAQAEIAEVYIEEENKALLLTNFTKNFLDSENIQILQQNGGFQLLKNGFGGSRFTFAQGHLIQEEQSWNLAHHNLILQSFLPEMIWLNGAETLVYSGKAYSGLLIPKSDFFSNKKMLKIDVLTQYESANHGVTTQFNLHQSSKNFYLKTTGKIKFTDHFSAPVETWLYRAEIFDFLNHYDNKLPNTASQNAELALALGEKNQDEHWEFFSSVVFLKNGILWLTPSIDYEIKNYKNEAPFHQSLHLNFSFLYEKKINSSWDFFSTTGFQRDNRKEEMPEFLAHQLYLYDLQENLKFEFKNVKKNYKIQFGNFNQLQYTQSSGAMILVPTNGIFKEEIFAFFEKKNENNLIFSVSIRGKYQYLQDTETPEFKATQKHELGYSLALSLEKYFENSQYLAWHIQKIHRFAEVSERKAFGAHYSAFRFERGNPNLTSEEGIFTEIPYKYEKKWFKIEVSPYLGWYWNYLFLTASGTFSSSPSSGQIYDYVEKSVLQAGTNLSFKFTYKNFSYMQKWIYIYLQNLTDHEGVPFTPPLQTQHQIHYFLPFLTYKIGGTIDYRYVFETWYTAKNENIISAYQTLNLCFFIEKKLKNHKIGGEFQINNLLNQVYIDPLSLRRLIELPEQKINFSVLLYWKL